MSVRAPFRWKWVRASRAVRKFYGGHTAFIGLLLGAGGYGDGVAILLPTLRHLAFPRKWGGLDASGSLLGRSLNRFNNLVAKRSNLPKWVTPRRTDGK